MELLIVAVPVFDANMTVKAYRLHTQSSDHLFGLLKDHTMPTDAMYSPGIEMINDIGIEPFTGGKPIFVEINQFQLLNSTPMECNADPSQLVIIISHDIPAEEPFIEKCAELKAAGYSIALLNYPVSAANAPIYQLAAYCIFDVTDSLHQVNYLAARSIAPHIKPIFACLEDQETFDRIKRLPNAMFEGKFYSEPVLSDSYQFSPVKASALQLLKIVSDEDFDLDAVSEVIKRDPAITISLLRFINSPAVQVRQAISSINNAVAILGQKETKRWIVVAVSTQLAQDKPSEIVKLSLIRAKFAENLANAFEVGTHASSLFLVGLFSLLDVVLNKPIEEAVRELSVSDKIREALVTKSGDLYDVLTFIKMYEQADWSSLMLVMVKRGIKVETVHKAFVDALVWYKELLETT